MYDIITSPEGSHNALFTNLLAASLSILADAVTDRKSIVNAYQRKSHPEINKPTYLSHVSRPLKKCYLVVLDK